MSNTTNILKLRRAGSLPAKALVYIVDEASGDKDQKNLAIYAGDMVTGAPYQKGDRPIGTIGGAIDDAATKAANAAQKSELASSDGSEGIGIIADGADAVPNTVGGKISEQGFSVTDFMNVFEREDVLGKFGLLDVSAAIAKAFARTLSPYFPEGRYFAPTVKWPQYARPRGAGRGLATIVGTSTSNGEILATSSVVVRGITFDTWNSPLLVTQSVLDGLDVSECEFVRCAKSVADRAGTTNTIDATKTVKRFTYWDNIDRDGEKAVKLSCLVQVASIQFNEVRNLRHANRAVAYEIGGEDGTDTVYDSYGVVIDHNDIEDLWTTALNGETHAVLLFAKDSSASNNDIRNVRNSNVLSVNGTEAVYIKGPGSRADYNRILDGGLGQGSIVIKNKNSTSLSAKGNRIRYVNVTPLTGSNWLTGIYISEVAGSIVDLEDNQVFGAQRGYAIPTEPGAVPERVSVARSYVDGDLYAGYYLMAARVIDLTDCVAKQTNPSSTGTSIGFFCTASASTTDVLSLKGFKTFGVYRSVVIAYSGTASIGLLKLLDSYLGVNNSIAGNRGLTYSGAISALEMSGNDLSQPTLKVVGTPPASCSYENNLGFKTVNSGMATIASASTVVSVAHGLAVTPRLGDISVIPFGLGLSKKVTIPNGGITDIGPNFFKIAVDVAPGSDTATFSWSIRAYGMGL